MSDNNDKKRVHLGVLFGTLISYCQYRIWDGIVEYAKQHDISLTAYFGTYYTTGAGFNPHYETCMENIRNDKTLSGIIVITSSVTTNMKPEYFSEYIKKIPRHLPVVSLGSPLPDIPSVLVDSVDGIYTIVNHLIKYHGKKKIAFIKGPDMTWEAEERLNGYKKALLSNKIDYDENLILPGNYLEESGSAAAAELLDNRKLDADAIVASNDSMASGVIRELKSRGIRVPADIAVTGFDDDIISWRTTPSITTIRQDFYKLGMVSAEKLCDIINGTPVMTMNFLPTVHVIRQSCGCFEGKQLQVEFDLNAKVAEINSFETFALEKSKPLLQKDVPAEKITKWVTDLVNIIKNKEFSRDKLQFCLYEILREYKHYSEERYVWCDILHVLIIGMLNFQDEMGFSQTTLSALISAITFVQDTIHNERQAMEYEANEFRMAIGRVANALVSSFDIDTLADELCKLLPRLFIKTALICLYRDPVINNDPDADRMLTAVSGYDNDTFFHIKRGGQDDLLSPVYSELQGFNFDRERRTLLFYPMFFGNEELGTVLLSYDYRVPMDAYASLRIDISTAVKGAALLSKIHALSIVDELTGLFNRRGFFQYASSRLTYMNREKNTMIPIVLYLDMDKLKGINDTYGHIEGDTAIAAFAKVLKSSLREADVIGRMGGDEFIVLSSVESEENIRQLINRLQEKFDEYNSKKPHPYKLSASIGSSSLSSPTMQCLEAAILRADRTLYDEKEKKRT